MNKLLPNHSTNFFILYELVEDLYLFVNFFNKENMKNVEKNIFLENSLFSSFNEKFSYKIINIAIHFRILDDKLNLYEYNKKNNKIVGIIDNKPLEIRESFNKIIHANNVISPDIPINDKEIFSVFYGNKNKKHWECKININSFIFCLIDYLYEIEQFAVDEFYENT